MLVGERLQLEIPIGNEILKVKGIVRRCYQEGLSYLVGVEFTDISRPDQEKIRKFLFALQLRSWRRD
jgi:c-di-GMP-binding flagellar brake protein YcgR